MHSTVDLFVGFGMASLIDKYFLMHTKNKKTGGGLTQIQLLASIVAQACISMLSAESLRRLLWANPDDDPSGGIMFILALSQQQMLWENLTAFFDNLTDNWLADSNNDANPETTS